MTDTSMEGASPAHGAQSSLGAAGLAIPGRVYRAHLFAAAQCSPLPGHGVSTELPKVTGINPHGQLALPPSELPRLPPATLTNESTSCVHRNSRHGVLFA